MVNTRRKSQAPIVDDAAQAASEQSDSSTTSVTRRSTRRSVGAIPIPLEVATPPRRSRRLSNSSVESVNNDTPRPATRRSSRNKPAGSDSEANEVELVVIKRRKVVEGVDTLNPITEEKPEIERSSVEETTLNVVKLDEEDLKQKDCPAVTEITLLESPRSGSPQKITSPKSPKTELVTLDDEVVKASASPTKESQANVQDEKTENDANKSVPGTPIKDIPAKIQEEKVAEHTASPATRKSSPVKVLNDEMKGEVQSSPAKTVQSPIKEVAKSPRAAGGSPLKMKTDENTLDKLSESEPMTGEEAGDKAVLESPKPKLLFGVPLNKIKTNTKLKLGLKAKKPKKNKKRDLQKKTVEKSTPLPPTKSSLPCNADIMRNIPRGKSVSGREWKEPKSNPRYLYKDKGLKMPLEKITQVREELRRVKELENRLKEEEQARRAEIKRRREINKKREEENSRRGEVVQVIRNTNKIKRMKKKQLKLIQKRDTSTVV